MELRRRQDETLNRVAEVLHVAGPFLERGVVEQVVAARPLSSVATHNLRVGLGMAPFRDYLALRVLATVQ
jgi:hypothetical protein